MELAALATAAVPGLSPTGVAAAADDARDFTAAVVIDSEGNRWRIRSPQHQEAAMRLETELQVLRGFSTSIRAELPFRVPSVAGVVRREEMRTFVYNHLPGASLNLTELAARPERLIDDVGRTIAAIHDLDEAVVDNADLPRYTAERFRQRRLNELDQAATTGQIPSVLLRRWEHALEEKDLWQFTPVVTHGDLHEDSLLIDDERVVAVTGWTDLHIGDPADDFAWLTASSDAKFTDTVLDAYGRHRRGETDEHLMRRAALAAEFALAQWLVRGHSTGNQEMVEEALGLLGQLKEDIETHGGQPIALTPPEEETPPAQLQHSKPVARPGAHATVADTGEWAERGIGDDEPAVITDASAEEGSAPGGTDEADGDQEAFTATAPDSLSPESGVEPSGPEDEDPNGRISPFRTRGSPSVSSAGSSGTADSASSAETGEVPSLPRSRWTRPAEEDEEPTGELAAVPEEPLSPSTGSLPIVPDEDSEKRAKRKNFFPTRSADSAQSARSAGSAESAESAESADSARSSDSAPSASSAASAPSLSTSRTRGSVYSTYPGLRPPGT